MKMFEKLPMKIALALVLLVSCSMAQVRNPFVRMEAENYSAIANAKTANDCGNQREYHVGSITSASTIIYGNVNFEKGAKAILIRMSGFRRDYATGYIILRVINQYTGPVIANITVGRTSGHCQFAVITNFLSQPVAGLKNLYVSFAFRPPKGTLAYFVDIDWFQFVRA